MRKPVGVIIAGGQARRMGGADKPMMKLAGMPLIDHVAKRILPQVETLAINANGDLGRFSQDCPVFPDDTPGFQGPLAGILTAMRWAEQQGASHLITLPADTPFLPDDFVTRLMRGLRFGRSGIVVAADESGVHPVAALWSTMQEGRLRQAMEDGVRKVMDFTNAHNATIVSFQGHPFMNINTPEDLAEAETRVE